MQACEMLLLNGRDETGGLECTDGDVGIERFGEAPDYDEGVGVSTGRNGRDCA